MIRLRRKAVPPPDGARAGPRPIYAIGDIHGCYDLFRVLLAEVARDAAARGGDTPATLILCGDYVDRGPASAKVLAAVAWLARSGTIDVRLLDGNHEEMLRGFLERPVENAPWLSVGGRETLASYGVAVPPDPDDAGTLVRLRDGLLDAMPISHFRLLRGLELMIRIGDYAFVHAGVAPGVPLAKQSREDLLWIREEFLDHPRPAEAVIVHGHSWSDDQPAILPHRIGIDTGVYKTGVLTAVSITDDAIEVIQAVQDDPTRSPA